MKNRVVHFEIPSNDPKVTMEFFKKTFGWNFKQMGEEDYWMAITGEKEHEGINGAIIKRRHPEHPVSNSIGVENIDRTIELIKANGGTMVVDKTAIPQYGWFAFFKDTDENIHGLLEMDSRA